MARLGPFRAGVLGPGEIGYTAVKADVPEDMGGEITSTGLSYAWAQQNLQLG